MNSTVPLSIIFSRVVFLLLITLASCGQATTPKPLVETTDTFPVKEMGTDSSSEMPVYEPKDTSAAIPNPYDSSMQ